MNIPDTLLDNDGYPTEEWLEFIRNYTPSQELPILKFVELLEEGWYFAPWGFTLKRKNKGKQKLLLSTGGWSGNEEIVESILSNLNLAAFHIRYKSWKAGGHHEFEIKL
jgi:hypothetical protein